MLGHLSALVPSERTAQLLGEVRHGAHDRIAHRCGAVTRKRRSVFLSRTPAMLGLRRQVQQNRIACGAFDQRSDRRTRQPQDQIAFPVPGHRAILDRRRPLAEQYLGSDEGLSSVLRA